MTKPSLSIRARAVLGATAAVALALVIAATVFRMQLTRSLTTSIRNEALERAADVAQIAAEERPPLVLPNEGPTVAWIQMVDAHDNVVSSSFNARTLVHPLISVTTVRTDSLTVRTATGLPINQGATVVVASARTTGTPALTVLVALPLTAAESSDHEAAAALLRVFPVLLGLFAIGTWVLIGRALSPVEALRREVDTITATDLRRRVPIPTTHDEISRLAETMNAMLARLGSSAERQRTFVADASHELRSPLASLRTQLETSGPDHPDAAWERTVADMLTEHDRLERLLRDLLLLAQDDSATTVKRDPLDLGHLVRHEVARRPLVTGIERIVDAPNVLVLADDDALTRIVRNLLDNAERHARSQVHVAVRRHGSAVTLTVSDDGAGVPPEWRDKIFERFTRIDHDRSADNGGSGLGLAIVRSLITAQGGTVALTAQSPGATFVVTIAAL